MLYINYMGRIKLGIRELNPIWRKFDLKKGKMKFLGFILQSILVIGTILIIFSLPENIFEVRGRYFCIGIAIGFLLFNFWYDFWALYNFKKRKSVY